MITLTELGHIYKTDKATFHCFTQFYEEHFSAIRERENDILEIGILLGGSIRMLYDYFNKSNIHAVDIVDKSDMNNDRIKTYVCDQSKIEELKSNFSKMQFNLIIDDGGHTMEQQQNSFKYLWSRLFNNGMYVVEDLHTSLLFNQFGFNKAGETTYDMVKALSFKTNFQSDFITADEFQLIKEQVSSVEIFTKENNENEFKQSITSVIYKK